LQDLHDLIKKCSKCRLRATCTQVVPGEGPQNAKIVFIAEAPGEEEDKQGRPLIGRSGQLFRNALKAASIKEDEVFISNTCKCRPPDNREPNPDEIEACWPWTLQLLQRISPKIIVPLGAPATMTLAMRFDFQKQLGGSKITQIAGKPVFLAKRHFYVFPMFHPSFANRQNERRSEFQAHMRYLGKAMNGWLERPI